MTEHSELIELAALLPLGGLDPDDERRLEEHLRAGCAECERALREASLVVDALAEGEPGLEPSLELRARILARAAGAAPAAPARRARSRLARIAMPVALAAGALVAALLGLEVRGLRGALDRARETLARLESELAGARSERERLARELAGAEATLGELTARATRTVALSGTGPAPAAAARAYLDPRTGRLTLLVYDLPPPPPERSYQLWVIVGDEPASAGVFDVGPGGQTRYQTTAAAPSLEGPLTLAVTIEPKGGLPKPSGPIVLAGS